MLQKRTFLLGLFSLLWLILRTGTKPSRAVYPCQRAAAANSYIFLTYSFIPILAVAQGKMTYFLNPKVWATLTLAVLMLGAAVWWYTQQAGSQVIKLTLTSRLATGTKLPSNIFVVDGTTGKDEGLSQLINLMGSHGLLFYKSGVNGTNRGPNGLIARDDVVLIKVNCQWAERGGTNTDLLKALIQIIVDHPDGFMGEIIVADNGQDVGGNLNWPRSNAEDHSQSAQKVVDMFSSSYKVSTFLWDAIRGKSVTEYSLGNTEDGYVVNQTADSDTGIRVSYPKFRTKFGTYVSFKGGIWDPSTRTYDHDRLKVINVPVLKSHSSYGVTATVKHYMGVVSQPLTNAHDFVGKGGIGTEMVETRFPVLNILDAIWVNANPKQSSNTGPGTPYAAASNVRVIMASTDPVALDYWAAKYVLVQTAKLKGETNTASLDPDNPNRVSGLSESFHVWLKKSMEEILAAGYQVTMNEDRMNVYVVHLPQKSQASVSHSSPKENLLYPIIPLNIQGNPRFTEPRYALTRLEEMLRPTNGCNTRLYVCIHTLVSINNLNVIPPTKIAKIISKTEMNNAFFQPNSLTRAAMVATQGT